MRIPCLLAAVVAATRVTDPQEVGELLERWMSTAHPPFVVGVNNVTTGSAEKRAELNSILALHGIKVEVYGASRMAIVEVDENVDRSQVQEAMEKLLGERLVRWIELDDDEQVEPIEELPRRSIRSYFTRTGDELSQWYVKNMKLTDAWKITKGAGAKVMIVEEGFLVDHPDLRDSLWKNPHESMWGDNDNNGYVGDIHGINTANSTGDLGGALMSHGTGVTGCAVGSLNGEGSVGSAPEAEAVLCRFRATRSISDLPRCLDYAVTRGVKIMNLSFSYGSSMGYWWRDFLDELDEKGVLLVTSAGNSGVNILDKNNIFPEPQAVPHPAMIAVAMHGNGDKLAAKSNFSADLVSISAPGDTVLAPWLTSSNEPMWGHLLGTSFSSPFTAGCGALALSANPSLSHRDLKTLMESTARKLV
ncbi:MAG: LOW QUALITY PROTEIN: hypothetical protein KVP17_002156 [Porospora cf. gigantea B]|uniref:uncharacterized protein n=1 Tax=Porospora cf. gigantea B TaxID=2853592 RepID=UPI0035718928|nr:MAG: LOW QUALITY PROTEIN: hypothetical protein KVP17_002156 [Porospora cf. gigantea B]